MKTKKCCKCDNVLPLDPAYFYKKKASKDGWDYRCKKCWGTKSYGLHQINKLKTAKEGYKFCSLCEKELIFNLFSKCKENKDGYKNLCKKCSSSKSAEYQARSEVKKRRSEYGKQYRKMYYATEKGKIVNKRNVHIRRSRKQNNPYNYSLEDWRQTLIAFNDKCAYCKVDGVELQQEHIIPLSKGGYYVKQNIIPACQRCNGSKHNYELIEWYSKQPYFSEERLKTILKWAGINTKSNTQQLSIL